MRAVVHVGNVLDILPTLESESVNCVVTSPPYWGLRDYGTDGQLGLEPTPEAYVANMVRVFAEVWRVLRDDGTLWLNLGDTYASAWPCQRRNEVGAGSLPNGKREARPARMPDGLKEKDLCGIPWRVAFALQADGWYLRSDIIWSKPNPMPESVTDRPTKAHEYVFLLSKRERYYYDTEAIADDAQEWFGRSATFERDGAVGQHVIPGQSAAEHRPDRKRKVPGGWDVGSGGHATIHREGRTEATYCDVSVSKKRNRRTVWTIATQPYPDAHFATYPEKLVEPCVLAGCPVGGTVLDPFTGSGTTGAVACRLGRNFVGVELNAEYAEMAERRIAPHRDQMQMAVSP